MVSSLSGGNTLDLFGFNRRRVDPVQQRLSLLNSGLNNALASSFEPGRNLSAAQIRSIIAGPQTGNVSTINAAGTPPWEDRQAEVQRFLQSDADKLQELMSRTSLFRSDEEIEDGGSQTDEMKNLFLLHKGMDRLNQLAEYMQSGESRGQYGDLLERQFQSELAELREFYNNMSFNSVEVSEGSSKVSERSDALVADRKTFFHGKLIGNPDEPLAGLTGNETFSLSFERPGTGAPIPDIQVDLSEISGDLSVNNVVNLINEKIADYNDLETTKTNEASILTQFDLYTQEVKDDKGNFLSYRYGIKITPGLNETLNMQSQTGAEDAVYLSGVQGGGTGVDSFLRKLDTLGGGVPEEVFYNTEDTGGRDVARNVATDSKGNVYTLGTSNRDVGLHSNQSGNDDVVLRKYSQAGQMLWETTLGSDDTTTASSIAIDSQDNIVIAGQTFGTLSQLGGGGNGDTFVTKYDTTGKELWTHQNAPFSSDGANAITIGADDSVIIGGYSYGNLPGETHAGGSDAYMRKLSADGVVEYDRQFGTAGSDVTNALATDDAGNIFVASVENGQGYITKYADSDGSAPLWKTNIGAIDSAGISSLSVENGKIYVGGTSIGGLNGNVTAGQEYSGGSDGFVMALDDAGGGSIDFTSYIGSNDGATESVASITVRNGDIYVGGTTSGSVDGGTTQASASVSDGFLTKLNSSGSQDWTHQFGGSQNITVTGLAFEENGSNVLSRLGLPEGQPYTVDDLTPFRYVTQKDTNVVSQSSLRAGDSFSLSVNGGSTQSVTLEQDDSIGFFAFKINRVLGNEGRASIQSGENGQYISITAFNDTTIELKNGPDGLDALKGLGIQAGTIYGVTAGKDVFSLGLIDGMSVANKRAADDTTVIFAGAMRQIEKAYNKIAGIEEPDLTEAFAGQQNNGPVPAYLQRQINGFNAALQRLGGPLI